MRPSATPGLLALLLLLSLPCPRPAAATAEAPTSQDQSMLGRLRHGLHAAGRFLGLDHAGRVAKLVAQAFADKTPPPPSPGKGEKGDQDGIFAGFLRILGFDTKKIGAIAVNAVIFFAQLISSSLTTIPPSQLTHARELKNGTPFEWMMTYSRVADVLSHAKDRDLPDQIVMYIKEHSLDEETDCVQLLVCKMAPVIWSMQKALDLGQNRTKGGVAKMFALLPSVEEFADHGDKCDKQHPFCFIDL